MNESYSPTDLFPPEKYIRINKVPVFDEHENPYSSQGKPKKVTADDLKRIAKTCNSKFDTLGVATPLSIGHSKDEADEEDQPKIVGWAVNFNVDKFAKTGRKALYCDWYVRRSQASVIDEFPFRSVEWWRSSDDLNPISLLRTAPERDLSIIRYSKETAETPYRYSFDSYTPPSPKSENVSMNEDEKLKVADAVAGESSSTAQQATEIANLKEQMGQLTSMLQELMQLVQSEGAEHEEGVEEGDDSKDLLDQAGDDEKDDAEGADDEDKKGDEKEEADSEEEPEKYESAAAGPGNTFTPGMEKPKKMSRTNEDELVAKYERLSKKLVKDATEALMKENEDLRVQYNRGKAEKAVANLETEHNVDFGAAADREEEVQLLTNLLSLNKKGDSFKAHCDKIARKYKRKEAATPDSNGAAKAVQFSRTPEDGKPAFNGAEDVAAFLKDHATDSSLTPESWAAKRSGRK